MYTHTNRRESRRANNNLRALRREARLTLYGLAALAESSAATIINIERYDHVPGPDLRERFARALGVTVSDIWPHLEAKEE